MKNRFGGRIEEKFEKVPLLASEKPLRRQVTFFEGYIQEDNEITKKSFKSSCKKTSNENSQIKPLTATQFDDLEQAENEIVEERHKQTSELYPKIKAKKPKKKSLKKQIEEVKEEESEQFDFSIREEQLNRILESDNFVSKVGDDDDDIDALIIDEFGLDSDNDSMNAVCNCKATVLIVDDNVFNLFPLEMILQGFGLFSEKASGGQEAIDRFIANRKKKCCKVKFQLVLMDLNMPEVDGFKATTKILAYQQAEINRKMKTGGIDGVNDSVPAVVAAVTAFVNDSTLRQCYQVGMVDVMSKPVISKSL